METDAAQTLRREGMAEAVVRVVLSRRAPFLTADDWCDLLGLERAEILSAVQRMKVNAASVPVGGRSAPPHMPARKARRESPRFYKRPCPFCSRVVSHGKHWSNHMARYHPGEWEAELERRLAAQYVCPECGEQITTEVTIHIERHECVATREPETVFVPVAR